MSLRLEGVSGVFNDRQLSQIYFATLYAKEYGHGAQGHNDMIIIAKLSAMVLEVQALADSERPSKDKGRALEDIVEGWEGTPGE